MSGGAVFREALRILNAQPFPREAATDLLAVMEAARTNGALPTLLYEAGAEAGLPRETLLGRTAGLFLFFAAGNLADDLIDGDVTYLAPAVRLAPSAQMILQCLGTATLLTHGVPAVVVSEEMRTFARAASWSHVEVRTERWTLDRYQALATSTGGLQWVSYLRMLWHGTPLADRAEPFGMHAACVGYLGEDLRVNDRRYASLTNDERRALLAWGRGHLDALASLGVKCGALVQASVEPMIVAAEAAEAA